MKIFFSVLVVILLTLLALALRPEQKGTSAIPMAETRPGPDVEVRDGKMYFRGAELPPMGSK